jgi:hypothetical protein
MYTTLNAIRKCRPDEEFWEKLLTYLGKTKTDDEPLSIIDIIKSNGLSDALWCLQAVDGHDKEIRLFAVWCIREVQHFVKDKKSLDALDVAEAFANGNASKEELEVARNAAWLSDRGSSWAASAVTSDDAGDAVWLATRDSAWVASTAASTAAWTAAKAAQEKELIRICELSYKEHG